MIIMMKCSQLEGGPWLAIGELVALYTRLTCDPGPWPLIVKCWRRKIHFNSCKPRPVNQGGGYISKEKTETSCRFLEVKVKFKLPVHWIEGLTFPLDFPKIATGVDTFKKFSVQSKVDQIWIQNFRLRGIASTWLILSLWHKLSVSVWPSAWTQSLVTAIMTTSPLDCYYCQLPLLEIRMMMKTLLVRLFYNSKEN